MAYTYPYFGYDNNNTLAKDIQSRHMQGLASAGQTASMENHSEQRLCRQMDSMPMRETHMDHNMKQKMDGMEHMDRDMSHMMSPMEHKDDDINPMMHSQMNAPYEPQSAMAEALTLIQDAVMAEAEDKAFYEYIISKAPTMEEKAIITGIRDDEMKHFRLFRHIYHELTGTMLPESTDATFEKPASYCGALRKALLGEQNAVTKYRKILYAMTQRTHLNMLTEIITDELRHFGLYNYLYAKNSCTD